MYRILLVESDREKAAETVEKLRISDNFFVEFISEISSAISALAGNHGYSCVIASYEMPGMSGIRLIERIRVFDKKVGVVIIADNPEKAESETRDLDVMGVVDRNDGDGKLIEMTRQAIEFTEMTDEHRGYIEETLDTQSKRLDEISSSNLDAPPVVP